MKRDYKIIDFIVKNWAIFPKNCFYQTGFKGELIFDNKKCIYLYSFHKIHEVKIEYYLTTLFFRVYKIFPISLSELAGFVFIPSVPSNHKIRYTPMLISVTRPGVTEKSVLNSENKILIEDRILMLYYSCGCELITNIGEMMGVYLPS